jgi:uncharacterized membrane protein
MSTNRPKISVPFETYDLIIEMASIALLIFIWVHTFISFGDLPDVVATHFNGSGEADSYGSKFFIFFLPLVITALYLGLFYIAKKPHLHNYMVNITEDNAPRFYRFSVTVIRVVNFLCVLMFAYINYQIITGAQTGSTGLGKGFLFVVLGASILLPLVLLYFQNKIKP